MRLLPHILKSTSIAVLVLFILTSCEDLLDQKPPDDGQNILPSEAIETVDDLQQLLNSGYDVIANVYDGDIQNIFTLLTDNVERPVNQDNYTSVWLRNTTIFNGNVGDRFSDLYIAILRANTIIENIDVIAIDDEATRTRMLAEAHFIRALGHLEAVRGWAQPYDWTPSNNHPGVVIKVNTAITSSPRSSVGEVYAQILSDIEVAKNGLPSANGNYATRWAAIALEAEVRFQMHDYQTAFDRANEVIATGPYILDDSWLRYQYPLQSSEAIFYTVSTLLDDDQSVDSRSGVFTSNYFSGPNQLTTLNFTSEFYNLITQTSQPSVRSDFFSEIFQEAESFYITTMFAPTLDRLTNDFNIPILSLTQLKLIRAESAAEIQQSSDVAINDINDIRRRAFNGNGQQLSSEASFQEIIEAARFERRMEFPVSGQRYHDLKRIGSQGEEVIVRGVPYDCPGMILQFPAVEGTSDFELNPGGGC